MNREDTVRRRRQKGRHAAYIALFLAALLFANLVITALCDHFSLYFYTGEHYEHRIGPAATDLFPAGESEGEGVEIIFCMAEEKLAADPIYSLVYNTARQLTEVLSFLSIRSENIYLNPGAVKPYRTVTDSLGNTVEVPITEESVIFVSGGRHKTESLESFFVLDEDRAVTAYNGEEVMLSCIGNVRTASRPLAAYTTSHGENFADMQGFYTLLLAAGYGITVLSPDEEIPDDVSLIVISNPLYDFDRAAAENPNPEELDRLDAFLGRGGTLYVSIDPYGKGELTHLRAFLASYGLTAGTEIIRDAENSLTRDGYTLVTDRGSGAVGDSVFRRVSSYTSSRAIVREASCIGFTEAPGWNTEALLLSSPTAVTYKNGVPTGNAAPYPVLALSRRAENGGAIILSSSVYFLADDVLYSGIYSNRTVALALLSELGAPQAAVGCTILPVNSDRLEDLTMRTARLYALLLIGVIPLGVAVCGVCVLNRRRRR